MQVIKAPDPRLKVKTKPVKKITPALLQTTKEMIKLTKTFTDPQGVGMASTQVGLDEQFFVALVQKKSKKTAKTPQPPASPAERGQRPAKRGEPAADQFMTVFNPKITWTSKGVKKYFEGCLSVPNYWGEVERHLTIKVSYQDETGKNINTTLKGVLAWIFQHEVDHLNGILFSERVLQQKGKFYKFTGKDKTGTDTFEEITI